MIQIETENSQKRKPKSLVLKEMFNIFSDHGNESQKNFEISSFTHQASQDQSNDS